jgi:dienelactone hydrolase
MRITWLLIGILLSWRVAFAGAPLPGTAPLDAQGDLAAQMVQGIDRFLMRQTEQSVQTRTAAWSRVLSSPDAYQRSVAPNRARFAKMLGVVDERRKVDAIEFVATTKQPALIGRAGPVEIYVVRWPVMGRIDGEGLLLAPAGAPLADVVALLDADQTPEMIAGLADGVARESQFALRLARSGCRVLVPALVDRSDTFAVLPSGKKTNLTDREYVYRPAYELGRHPIGYEVQKVLAAVDWFSSEHTTHDHKIGVIGYGEGGLLAFYAAALDTRIKAACVSGYFDSRQQLWQEPIYRNVFGLLEEFGDAEIASLIAPRALIVEACRAPEVDGSPRPRDGLNEAAPGRLTTLKLESVRAEVERARALLGGKPQLDHLQLKISGDDGRGPFGSNPALKAFFGALGVDRVLAQDDGDVQRLGSIDASARLGRLIDQMQEFTQSLLGESEYVRQAFWKNADRSSPEKWHKSTRWYRDYFANEVIGRFDDKLLPPNARTRQIYDAPAFTGYEVMLDVYPDVFASGILLVPKGMSPGEKRPVVVCQHGLEGRPQDVADPSTDSHFYHRFACQLAGQGFITYAPQNPYIGQDRFRVLLRKAHPLKKTLYSIIVPQHQQTVDWLASLPFVDPDRIAFYGLSYGGKTAMRVPALVDRYCLSICSGDFNEWIYKCGSIRYPRSYVGTIEYDMYEWDLGETFNYSDMAGLIAPRPFMVERGHHDTVGDDDWISHEYANVRLLYSDLKIPERTTIEYFDGPHTIHGVGTFKFLHEQLQWPK